MMAQLTAALSGILVFLVMAGPVNAQTSGSGNVAVTATVSSEFSLTLDSATAAFGTTLSPSGTSSDQTDVTPFQDATTGAYYVKKGAASNYALVATVRSNKAWTGSVTATENGGTSGMTVGGGGLRWKLGDMANLTDAQGGTAFTTSADAAVWNTPSVCASGTAKNPGVCTYNFTYSLRVRWTEAPGTFSSTLTYTATQ